MLVAGLIVGAFGFSNVVGKLYPIIGGIGIAYIAANTVFLVKTRVKRKIKRGARKLKTKVAKAKTAKKIEEKKARTV